MPFTSGSSPVAPNAVSSCVGQREAISAPPPKPMIAMPVDSPAGPGTT